MDAKYEEGIKCLKQCWKECGHSITDEEKAVMKSFRGFFLSGKSEPYSHEAALKWLSDNQLAWGVEKYQVHRKLIYELNDAVSTGTIKEEYRFSPTTYDSLPLGLKDQLILYRNDLLSRLQYRSSRDRLFHCVSFADFLKTQGILQATTAGYAIKRFSGDISDFEKNGLIPDVYWKSANDLIDILRKKYHHNEDAIHQTQFLSSGHFSQKWHYNR